MRNVRLGCLFALLGCALSGMAIIQGGYWLVALWLGVNFLVIAVGYLNLAADIFAKKPTGRLPLVVKAFFFPYLLYATVIWLVARLVSQEDVTNRVTDEIIVGRRLLSSELKDHYDLIVDLTSEFDEPGTLRSHPGYRNFPILDASAPSPAALRQAIESLPPGIAFIHCAQGHGRTGLFALALLLHRKIVPSIEEGLELLKSVRPGIGLNAVQLDCIHQFFRMPQPT